jgi:hypothetical protein
MVSWHRSVFSACHTATRWLTTAFISPLAWIGGSILLAALATSCRPDVHHDSADPLPRSDSSCAARREDESASKMVGNSRNWRPCKTSFIPEVAQLYDCESQWRKVSHGEEGAGDKGSAVHLRETGDNALKSAVLATIRAGIENDPGPWLLTFA